MIRQASPTTTAEKIRVRQRARRTQTRISWKQRIKTFFALVVLFILTAIAAALLTALSIFWSFSNELHTISAFQDELRPPTPTTVWSEDGVLLAKLRVENRIPIEISQVDKFKVAEATIAIEDRRFYEHPGVDLIGIGRVLWAELRGSTLNQGASTLTQQLVRQPSLGTQFGLTRERVLNRKVREALVALRMEQLYSKREILQLYLNNVYYGSGAYGVEAAARTFYYKTASQLNLNEATVIAGLPQNPSTLNPYTNPDAVIRRRNMVLDAMLETKKISQQEYDATVKAPLGVKPIRKREQLAFKAPYFVSHVLKEIEKQYPDQVYSGLKIQTSLNWQMQQLGEQALEQGIQRGSWSGANQGALVSIDNRTGYIRTMVGGRSYKASQYNNVTQGKRQPGSTFKVFDYAAAFDLGAASLYTTFQDRPIPYPNDPKKLVKNYSNKYSYAWMTCYNALANSTNTIAVAAAQKVGIRKVNQYAYKMGITTKLFDVLPTALGASEVRPIDLCSAYSVFAAKGTRFHPLAIVRITDADGTVLDAERYQPRREINILKQSTIEQMDKALQAVVENGTGKRARSGIRGIIEGARGKTGTTSNNHDAWFAGYNPELTTVVWVARIERKGKRNANAPMYGATGGELCAPIWNDYMGQAVPIQRTYNETNQPIKAPIVKSVILDPVPTKRTTRRRNTETTPNPTAVDSTNSTDDAEQPEPDNEPIPDNIDSMPPPETSEPPEEPTPITTPPQPTTKPTPGAPPSQPTAKAQPTSSSMQPATKSQPTSSPAQPATKAQPTPPPAQPTTKAQPTSLPSPSPSLAVTKSTPTARVRENSVRTAPPAPRLPAPEQVSITICEDSGKLAGRYCDQTSSRKMTTGERARLAKCRLHKPPPGEPD